MAAWAGLGYYARARNLVACARRVAGEHAGRFPDGEAGLLKLPGVGRYTAAAIAATAFGRRAAVVDANVPRVVSRLFAVKEPPPGRRTPLHALADSSSPPEPRGAFSQPTRDLGANVRTVHHPETAPVPLAHKR